MIRLWQIPLLLLIITITLIHYGEFSKGKTISKGWHFVWGMVYASPVIALATVYFFSSGWKAALWIILAAGFERLVFYNPILNILRGEKLFYISVQSPTDPSWWDGVELSWKGFYPYACGIGVLIFGALQYFIP